MAGPVVRIFDGYANSIDVYQGNPLAINQGALLVSGTDGYNTYPLLTDSTGALKVSSSGSSSNPSVGLTNSAIPSSATLIGASDGINLQAPKVFDLDTGPGFDYNLGISLRLPASGGSVVGGTNSDPIRVDPTGTTIQPISGTITANQGGIWTVQPGNTPNTTPWLTTINQGGNSATVTGANALKVDGSGVIQPVSGTITANIGTTGGLALDSTLTGGSQTTRITDGTNTATIKPASTPATATDTAIVVAISPNNPIVSNADGYATTTAPSYTNNTFQPLSLTTVGALRVDGSAVTQPISAVSLPLPTGAATEATLATRLADATFTARINTLGQKTMANSTPVVISSDQSTISISGTVTSNIGTTGGLALDSTLAKLTIAQNTALGSNTQALVGGSVTTAAPAYTNGNINPLSLTTAGALRIDGSGVIQPVSGTVTANQGTANTLANAWPVQVTDGVNTATVSVGGAIKVDGSSVIQPISGTVTANAGTGNFTVIGTGTDNTTNSTTKLPVLSAVANTVAPVWTNGSMAPLSVDTSGSLRITGTVITTANPSVGTNALAIPTSSTQFGGSDGTNLQAIRVFDLDSSVLTTQYILGVGLRKAASGGSVEFGTLSDPIRTDPTGTTTQPVSGTVTANQGTNPWITDVTDRAARLLGVIYGSQGQQIKQTATNFNTQVEIAVGGTLIDPRQIRALTSSDVVTANAGTGTFNIAGTVTSNIGTTGGLALDTTLAKLTIAQSTALGSNTQALMGGSVTTAAPAYTNGNINPLSLTTTGALRVDGSAVTQPVSGTVTANQGGAPWSQNITQFGGVNISTGTGASGTGIPRVTVSNDSNILVTQSGTWTVQPGNTANTTPWLTTINQGGNSATVTASNALKVDGSAVTQPVSGTVTANIGTTNGLALDTTLTAQSMVDNAGFTDGTSRIIPAGYILDEVAGTALTENDGAAARIDSKRAQVMVIEDTTTRGQRLTITASNAMKVDGSAVTQPVSGTVTANQGTANTLANAWSVKVTDGTNTLPTGDVASRAIFEKITDGTNTTAVKAASTAAVAADPALVVTISPNSTALSVTVSNSPSNSTPTIVYGDVVLNTITTAAAERTTYTEQSVNFTGSVVSSNANDTSAGTGARQVKIYFVDSTGATAGTETVTMNGTTAVNLVTTTKCFIEKMEVISVGSTGNNVGIITLFTGAGGTGTNVGTIAATDNKTFWAHHYVVTGKTFNLTSFIAGSTQSTAGNGSSWVLKSKPIGVANAVEVQVNDTVTLYGQSSQVTRNYTTAIPVASGPTRIRAYVTTLAGASATYRSAFDFYEA